jgi:hypothetical protein
MLSCRNRPVIFDLGKDIEDLNRKINDDRRMLIYTRIIQIMKVQQTQNKLLLIRRILEELSSGFVPGINMIGVNPIQNFIEESVLFFSYRNVFSD